jgi:hypothetical protein
VLSATTDAKPAMNTDALNVLKLSSQMLLDCALLAVLAANNVPLPLNAKSAKLTSSPARESVLPKIPTVKRRETTDVNNARLDSTLIRTLDSAHHAQVDALNVMLLRPATNVPHLSSLPTATENAQLRLGSLLCLLFSVLLFWEDSGKDIAFTPRREPLL